jgi:hypothetical protein
VMPIGVEHTPGTARILTFALCAFPSEHRCVIDAIGLVAAGVAGAQPFLLGLRCAPF